VVVTLFTKYKKAKDAHWLPAIRTPQNAPLVQKGVFSSDKRWAELLYYILIEVLISLERLKQLEVYYFTLSSQQKLRKLPHVETIQSPVDGQKTVFK
jgi:hypothetical protein